MLDKDKLEQKMAAAESRWEAAQLQAANAQRELDYAVTVFEKHKDELGATEQQSTVVKIDEQRNQIKTFLLKSQQVYQSAVLHYNSEVKKNA
jgi:hypothetical protein